MRDKFTVTSYLAAARDPIRNSLRVLSIVLLGCFYLWVPAATAAPSIVAELSASAASRATAVSGATPILIPPSGMRVHAGETADQAIQATDAGGDPLTFSKGSGPEYMTVTTLDSGIGTATGNIHLAPPALTEVGVSTASVVASDGVLSDERSFNIVGSDNPPALLQPLDMQVEPGRTADQALSATDADHDALTFSLAIGPWFVTVNTTGADSGNVHLTPALADSGVHRVTVSVSDGVAADFKSFQVSVLDESTPVLAQPNDMTVAAGQDVAQGLSATNADGRGLSFYKAEGPAYMRVGTYGGPFGITNGVLHLTPQLTDSPTPTGGTFAIPAVVGVTNGRLTDTKSFTIRVTFPPDHPPVLEQPADMTTEEGFPVNQFLSYSDPDGDFVVLSVVSGPSFMTMFFPAVHLNPTFTDAGVYTGTIRATDSRGLSDEKSFHITILNTPAPPLLDQPSDMIAFVGQISDQEIRARDPDGNPLSFSKYRGPAYMSVTTTSPGTGSGTGNIRLSPIEADLGVDTAFVMASDGIRGAQARFAIGVFPVGRPVLVRIGDQCVARGYPLSVLIRAVDPEGDRLAFSQTGLPSYASFTDNGNGTATLLLSPQRAEPPGATLMTVAVSDGTMSGAETFAIYVPASGCGAAFAGGGGEGDNKPPVSISGGPYTGLAGDPVAFDGTQSSDPEGQSLRFAWNLGDGAVAVGPSPSHTYARGGRYDIELLVTDGLWPVRASTTATIADAFAARAFAPEGRTKVRLDSGKPTLCVQIEPVNHSYRNAEVDLSSIVMISAGTGSVGEITAIHEKTAVAEDRDGNGAEEITACFSSEDLRQLFSRVAHGRSSVTVDFEGRVLSGGKFRAEMALELLAGKGPLSATVSPNPLNPDAKLSFLTLKPGPVKVSVFDPGGRLVRTLRNEAVSPAGYHEMTFDGRGEKGERLGSGIYFYRVETPDGLIKGRFVVLK